MVWVVRLKISIWHRLGCCLCCMCRLCPVLCHSPRLCTSRHPFRPCLGWLADVLLVRVPAFASFGCGAALQFVFLLRINALACPLLASPCSRWFRFVVLPDVIFLRCFRCPDPGAPESNWHMIRYRGRSSGEWPPRLRRLSVHKLLEAQLKLAGLFDKSCLWRGADEDG